MIHINRTRISKWIYSTIPIRWQWRVEKRLNTEQSGIYLYTVNYMEDRSSKFFNIDYTCTEDELITMCDEYVKMANRWSGVRVR